MTSSRRKFLKTSALTGTALWGAFPACAANPSSTLRVAVIGLRGRGKSHINGLAGLKGVKLVALCDVDPQVLAKATRDLDKRSIKVTGFSDFRKLCEDGSIDAVAIATPNHTHALISVTAAANGKHVLVEKPVSHNLWEGRQMATAAERFGVVIQHGFQRRSENAWHEAFDWVKSGQLGKLKIARGFCYKPRRSIGKVGTPTKPPEGVDYSLWCGPRELLPVERKQFHYDWHWQFPWGNGDLGNQGPHQLDVCRWALGDPMHLPKAVQSFGNRFAHDDNGDWANTQIVHLDYDEGPILFEVRGLPKRNLDYGSGMDSYRGQSIGNVIEYEDGALIGGHRSTCVAVDSAGKEVKKFGGGGSSWEQWVAAIRSGRQEPGHTIENGHFSSALAHIGNISWRLGSPKAGTPEVQDPAMQEALDRMQAHLAANGIDLSKTPMNHGPRMELLKGSEAFTETWQSKAEPFIKGHYRQGFELPL